MRPPCAMISYSWADENAAELLHDELALRGFEVIHDRYSFDDGSRIPANMAAAVERADAFIPYLTPSSLYLDRDPDAPQPALRSELKPALRRRRQNLRPGLPDRPVIVPLTHGLGDRASAAELLRGLTGEDFSSLWSTAIAQDTDGLTQSEAASVAAAALAAVELSHGADDEEVVGLRVATRGTSPGTDRFTIDATRLLGGERTAGTTESWDRFGTALSDTAAELRVATPTRQLRLQLPCHLSAALGVGRTFHQASGWSVTIESRHGDVAPATDGAHSALQGAFDQHQEQGNLLVDIDLLGHSVAARADDLASDLPPLGGRISLTGTKSADLTPAQIAASAFHAAALIRGAHGTVRPTTIHVTQAAPAAFSALLGHGLSALSASIQCYELADTGYVAALELPATTP